MTGLASAKLPENGPCIVPNAREYVQHRDMVSVGILTKMRAAGFRGAMHRTETNIEQDAQVYKIIPGLPID